MPEAAAPIRVLRVIEYHYKDVATYLSDRMDWTEHSPQPGSDRPEWLGMSMHSAIVSVHMSDEKGNWEQYGDIIAPSLFDAEGDPHE